MATIRNYKNEVVYKNYTHRRKERERERKSRESERVYVYVCLFFTVIRRINNNLVFYAAFPLFDGSLRTRSRYFFTSGQILSDSRP